MQHLWWFFAVIAKASSYFCRVGGGFQGFHVLVYLVDFFFPQGM